MSDLLGLARMIGHTTVKEAVGIMSLCSSVKTAWLRRKWESSSAEIHHRNTFEVYWKWMIKLKGHSLFYLENYNPLWKIWVSRLQSLGFVQDSLTHWVA